MLHFLRIRGCFLRLDLVDEKMREGKPLPYRVADILPIAGRFSWWLYTDEQSLSQIFRYTLSVTCGASSPRVGAFAGLFVYCGRGPLRFRIDWALINEQKVNHRM